jgi:hypothetical protein
MAIASIQGPTPTTRHTKPTKGETHQAAVHPRKKNPTPSVFAALTIIAGMLCPAAHIDCNVSVFHTFVVEECAQEGRFGKHLLQIPNRLSLPLSSISPRRPERRRLNHPPHISHPQTRRREKRAERLNVLVATVPAKNDAANWRIGPSSALSSRNSTRLK